MRATSPTLLYSLRVFGVAARLLSFKSAADALFLTPSAVSHRIADLERHLGIKLFTRKTRAVELTNAGRDFLQEIEPLLSGLDRSLERMTQRVSRKLVRVYAPPLFAHELLLPQLRSFFGLQPRVDVQLSTETDLPTEHPASADVSFLYTQEPPREGVVTELMAPRYVAAAARPVAAIARELGPKMFARQRLIVYRHRPEMWRAWTDASGLAPAEPRSLIEVDSMQSAMLAAERGLGIALVPASMCDHWFRSGRLARVSDVEIDVGGAYYVVYRSGDRHRAEVRALTSWALSVFRQ